MDRTSRRTSRRTSPLVQLLRPWRESGAYELSTGTIYLNADGQPNANPAKALAVHGKTVEADATGGLKLATAPGPSIGTKAAVVSRITTVDPSTDYSNDPRNPTLIVGSGSGLLLSNAVGDGDVVDYIRFNVPDGSLVTSVLLSSYLSSDGRAFIALQEGPAFTTAPTNGTLPGARGFTHFGDGGIDGASVGDNLISKLGGPLASGAYSIWIQQYGAETNYVFTLGLEQVPAAPAVIELIASSAAGVAEDGTSNLIYTFTRSGATTSALKVNYTVSGSARLEAAGNDPADYRFLGSSSTATSRTITFAAGSATATVSVDPIADTRIEPNETVVLALEAGGGYTLGSPAPVVGRIANDDSSVSISALNAKQAEGDRGRKLFTFKVVRSGSTAKAATVDYRVSGVILAAVVDGRESADRNDFFGSVFPEGTLRFAAGVSRKLLSIPIRGDLLAEVDGRFSSRDLFQVSLSNPRGITTIAGPAAVGEIVNDDRQSSISFKLGSGRSSLGLMGSDPIHGPGNQLESIVTGNAANNRMAALTGRDLFTGGVTTDRDAFVYAKLGDSLFRDPAVIGSGGYFDEITDFHRNDRLEAPPSMRTSRLRASRGRVASLASPAVASVLSPSIFAAHSAAAFTASGPGTFIAMNDGHAGFQSATDSIVWLRNDAISEADVVQFI